MQRKIQIFWYKDVEVAILERLVGNIVIGYLATFTTKDKKFHRVYGATSITCWANACQEIRETINV